jgi:flagellar basal-body rod protein FlgF
MDAGFYSAATGMEAYLRAQEVIAHNLANANTVGFKRSLAVWEPFEAQLAAALGDAAGTQVTDIVTDFRPGPIESTDGPLDVAIQGDGFFVLEGPNGYLYTRKGNFTLSANGTVVDSVGRPVLGRGGSELRIPAETREVRVDQEGRVFADTTEVGRLWVVAPPDPAELVPAAYTAFRLPTEETPPTVREPRVVQYALEGSNTNAVDELVAMITTLRGFEAAQRILVSLEETEKKLSQAASEAST